MRSLLDEIREIRRAYRAEYRLLDDVHALCGAAFVTFGTVVSAIGLAATLGAYHG